MKLIMNDTPLVSIIIPAYNVEKYICKCIDTVLEQTYKNIEIIVINDGSTDSTGKLLDNYRNCVKIIHQNNSGVSASRNKGIDESNGDYIAFVDGDDYLSNDFVFRMVELALHNDAEFVISTKCFTKYGEDNKNDIYSKLISNEEATALLLSPEVIVGSWNKLYKKELLVRENIRFSTSLFYGEGLRLITTCAQLAKGIVVTNEKMYFYRRNNEFSATSVFKIDKYYNGEKSLFEIHDTLVLKDKKIETTWLLHLCMFYLGAITKISSNHLSKKYRIEYDKWKKFIGNNLYKLIFSTNVSIYRKVLLFCGWLCPLGMGYLEVKRKKRISEQSVS